METITRADFAKTLAQLQPRDQTLALRAYDLIHLRKKVDVHAVTSAIRTKNGSIYDGVHLEAYVGRIAVCAEAVALGAGAVNGDTEIETVVAVHARGMIVAPCGMCRELVSDYARDAKVIVLNRGGMACVMEVGELLPLKYSRD